MNDDQKNSVRATGEMLSKALLINAWANGSVAVAQLITALIVLWAYWGS